MTATEALQRLKDGNSRFVECRSEFSGPDARERKAHVTEGQNPFACVLSCSDSRVPSEHIFNCGFGDLFMVRIAGNICHSIEAGSVEFAVWELRVPLIVVLGHSHCGAVTAAVKGETVYGPVRMILNQVVPSVYQARAELPDGDDDAILASAIHKNVFKSIEDLLLGSAYIRRATREKRLEIHGAYYDIESGVVEWLGEHPRQSEWLGHR
ncbi:carbonic anhydrase [bacterium BMS3Bbin04]|nr:carbonic anhydrase [bacterium BMS3Bbin04]